MVTPPAKHINAEVIPLNIPLLLRETFANPAQFGLATDQNLTATCFSGSGCTENARYGIHSATPDPTKLIYGLTRVHPTEAGQRLICRSCLLTTRRHRGN